jgi:transcriptional regulator with GAF, ATPase, and Fis domain
MIIATGRRLNIGLPLPSGAARASDTLAAVERAHITMVLAECGGKVRGNDGAAARLGLSPRTLEMRLTKYGIRDKRGSDVRR